MALTKVTYSMIEGAAFNVFDYGATGDGVTNDTVAIQAAIDAAGVSGGVVYFPFGEYRIARNVGSNDRWGIKVPYSNVSLISNGASFRRFNTDISTYALAYPILFIGTPDSNVAAATENVVVEGITFIGENTQHDESGSSQHDGRTAIELKNTRQTTLRNNTYTQIDSSTIWFQNPVVYDYVNNVYYNTTKNYSSKISGSSFIAESHAVAGRALLHAINLTGIDFCEMTNNYFEWCDDCISGETTYNDPNDVETDTYTPSAAGWTLGAVKRSGRNWTFDNNNCYNSSEHAVYPAGMDVVISNNNIRTDDTTICNSDPVKIRSRNAVVSGNIVSNYIFGITVNDPSFNVTVVGNTISSAGNESGGVIDVNSDGLSTYISNRSAYLTSYLPMANINISGNTIILPAASVANSEYHCAMRVYTDDTDANYPDGQIQNLTITNNTVKNHNVGIYFINSLYESVNISGNSFFAKPFTTTGFSSGTTLNTRAAIQVFQSGAGGTLISLRKTKFTNNYVYGSTYLFCTQSGAGSAGTYDLPWNCSANRFDYVKNIKTADMAGFAIYNMFSKNTSIRFLDRTWTGTALDNSLGDGTSSDSFNRYTFQWDGTNMRFYTNDTGTYVTLN